MKLLTRYILREHIGPLLFALSSLTALLLLQQVAKQFGNLVGKGLTWGVIGEFFVLSIPFIIAMTMPMAVLVAVLYAFSRLTSENEVTALRASGISVMRLVRPAILGGAFCGLLMIIFNDQVLPRSNHRLRTLQTDIARKKPTFALREQVINEVAPGKLFLRTSHIDEATDRMREVTIYNFDDPERRKTIFSDSGVMGMTPDQKDLQMTLHDGYMQQIPRDNLGELTRLYFKTDLVRVRGVGNRFEQTEKDDYKSEREMSVCEMSRGLEQGDDELERAKETLAHTLVAATHYLATGQQLPAFKQTDPKPRLTAGTLYCKYFSAPIFGTANIADTDSTAPPPPPKAAVPPAQQLSNANATSNVQAPPRTALPNLPSGMSVQPPSATSAPAAKSKPLTAGESIAANSQATLPKNLARMPDLNAQAHGAGGFRPPPADLKGKIIGSGKLTPTPGKPSTKVATGKGKAVPQRYTMAQAGPHNGRPPSSGEATPPAGIELFPGSGSGRGRVFEGPKTNAPTSPAYLLSSAAQIEVMKARVHDAQTTMSRYETEIQKKFALATACIVFVLLGAPIGIRFPRGGVGLVIGVSIAVFALYYVGLIVGEDLADKLILDPVVAMWMANALFTVIGVFSLIRVQRVGGSARGGDSSELLDSLRTWLGHIAHRLNFRAERRRRVTA